MSNNFQITQGSGTIVATEEGSGNENYQKIKLIDPTVGSTVPIGNSANPMKVDGSGVTQPISGSVSISNFPATQPISGTVTVGNASIAVTGTFYQATQPVSIATMPTTPVTGTFWQATQPVSASSLPLPSGAATESTLSGIKTDTDKLTFTSTRLLVDGSGVTQPVSGTFFQATQPVSATSLPLPTGAATESTLSSLNGKVTAVNTGAVTISTALPAGTNVIGHIVADSGSTTAVTGNVSVIQSTGTNLHTVVDSGTVTVSGTVTANIGTADTISTSAIQTNGTQKTQIVDGGGDVASVSSSTGAISVASVPSNLSVTATGAAAAAVTLTLPAVASQFHYIALIEIEAYTTAARTGGATPVLVTSTNLPASTVWTFATAAVVGSTDTKVYAPCAPIRSAAVNTATTIVCPATTGIIWRVNVFYSTGV